MEEMITREQMEKLKKLAGLFEKSGICCSSIFQWCRFHIFIKRWQKTRWVIR